MHCKALLAFTACALIASQASAAQQAGSAKNRAPAREKTYCLQFEPDTGSRISRTECKTRKEWSRLGVQIDDLIKK